MEPNPSIPEIVKDRSWRTGIRLTDAFKNKEWRSTVIDRVIRSAVQGYAAVWLANGATYETLISTEPLKGAIVAIALSILFSLGATQIKNPINNSYTQ